MGPVGTRDLVQMHFAHWSFFSKEKRELCRQGPNLRVMMAASRHGPSGEGEEKLLDYTSNGLWSRIKGHTTDRDNVSRIVTWAVSMNL